MRTLAPALTLLLLTLAACGPKGGATGAVGGAGLPSGALDTAIGRSIGDPTTCVLIASRADRKVLYRYGDGFNCARGLPACDRPGTLSAEQALAFADGAGRHASCNSTPSGDRTVGWAQGKVASSHQRDLIYSAMMEGQRTLPGIEMSARLEEVFRNAGL
jgi:hypothetical protein